MANGRNMFIPKVQDLLWSCWDCFGVREEWRKNKVKSVCHKTNPMDNTSKILQSCSHTGFTSVKGEVKITCRVHWIQKIWDRKTHSATTSSEWVSCLPNGEKLLNINTNKHTRLITVNYTEPCSSYLGQLNMSCTCSKLPVPVPGLLNGLFFIDEIEGKEIVFIILSSFVTP